MKPIKGAALLMAATMVTGGIAIAGLNNPVAASVIYSESFSGSATATLDGTAPTVHHGTSAVWTAGEENAPGNGAGAGKGWFADGGVAVHFNIGSAYLSFTPTAGHVYTFSEDVDVTTTGSSSYALQAGFIGTPSTKANLSSTGYAYVGFRTPSSGAPVLYSSGNAIVGGGAAVGKTGVNTLSITLNTTAAQWTYQFTVNGKASKVFTFKTNPSITAVGMGSTGGSVSGTFSNFSLTESAVPGKSRRPQASAGHGKQ